MIVCFHSIKGIQIEICTLLHCTCVVLYSFLKYLFNPHDLSGTLDTIQFQPFSSTQLSCRLYNFQRASSNIIHGMIHIQAVFALSQGLVCVVGTLCMRVIMIVLIKGIV